MISPGNVSMTAEGGRGWGYYELYARLATEDAAQSARLDDMIRRENDFIAAERARRPPEPLTGRCSRAGCGRPCDKESTYCAECYRARRRELMRRGGLSNRRCVGKGCSAFLSTTAKGDKCFRCKVRDGDYTAHARRAREAKRRRTEGLE